MAKAYGYIVIAVILQGMVGLVGGVLPERWMHRHLPGLVGFAAGALLAAAFLDILPEAATAIGPAAFYWAFVGFLALALLEWKAGRHGHHHHEHGAPRSLGVSLLASDALHNIGDGAAVAAAFLTSPAAGVAVALAIAAHEIPHELGDYAILRHASFPRWPALLALGAVQLMAGVGAAAIVLLARGFEQLVPAALAIAAGTFFYIGATDLLPELHSGTTDTDRRERVTGLLAGIGLIGAARLVELAAKLAAPD